MESEIEMNTWYPVDTSDWQGARLAALKEYQAAQAKAKSCWDKLEKAMTPGIEKLAPEGSKPQWSRKFGKISVQFIEAKKAKSSGKSGLSI